MEEIINQARKDGDCESNIDINDLLSSIENVHASYLENKTTDDIMSDIIEVLNEHDTANVPILVEKLMKYRYVDEINDLMKGRMVRWLRLNGKGVLTNGGIVTNITFTENGINVQCMCGNRRFIVYKFDECLTFQKLTVQEEVILLVNENIDNSDDEESDDTT
jgi:ribosomal protein L35AE/L33A